MVEHKKNKNEIYYRLLRPEFVMSWSKSLSSDAFSVTPMILPLIHCNSDGEVLIPKQIFIIKVFHYFSQFSLFQDIKEATAHLHSTVIPACVTFISKVADYSTFNLKKYLHSEGVNLRHISSIRNSITEPKANKFLLLEMVAR
jgi:hypothetical protein